MAYMCVSKKACTRVIIDVERYKYVMTDKDVQKNVISATPSKTADDGVGTDLKNLTLGTNPIGRLLVQYSVPAIIASVATSLYNIIDSIFIGRGVGAMAISGLAITFPLMNLVAAFCMLIAAGGATISSIYLGRKNYHRATDVVNNVLVTCLIHSVVFGGLAYIFLDDILTLFGATAETLPYARSFMQIILLGTPISYVFIGLNNVMRATGYPRKAMVSAFLSVLANLIFAPIFIFVLGWGIRGAATATIVGQTCACVWVVAHFLNKKSTVHLDVRNSWFDFSIVKRMYSIGMSPFLMNCTACFVVVFLNKALLDSAGADGNLAVGAYGIINRTTMFFVMIIFGVTQGMQPILGYNIGAGNLARVKETLKKGIIIATCISGTGWIVTQLFPDTISSLFTTDERMIELARTGFRIYFIAYIVVGPQVVIQNFFQSIGHPVPSIFLSLTRQLIFLLPLLWILPRIFGVDGVWISMTGSDILAFILALIVLVVIMRRLTKQYNQSNAQPSQKHK